MRKLLRVIVVVCLIGMMIWMGFLTSRWIADATRSPGVNVENYRRLSLGMTEEEVEGILGRPGEFEPESPHWKQWNENGTFISVGFGNHDGTMNCATANVLEPGWGRYLLVLQDEPIIDSIRRKLGF